MSIKRGDVAGVGDGTLNTIDQVVAQVAAEIRLKTAEAKIDANRAEAAVVEALEYRNQTEQLKNQAEDRATMADQAAISALDSSVQAGISRAEAEAKAIEAAASAVQAANEASLALQYKNDAAQSAATAEQIVGRAAMTVSSVADLLALPEGRRKTDLSYIVTGYHPSTIVGGGTFLWDVSRPKTDHNGGTVIDPDKEFPEDWSNSAAVTTWFTATNSGTGCWVRCIGDVVKGEDFGITASGIEDETAQMKALWAFCDRTGIPAILPPGEIVVSDTLEVTGRNKVCIKGAGYVSTIITFNNSVQDKPLFYLKEGSTYTELAGFTARDKTPGTSTGIKMMSTLSSGSPNWKNRIEDFRFENFKTGALATTENPLDGSTHAWLDGGLWLNGKFRNCRTSYLNQNLQAVNTHFVAVDMENDSSGEQYTMIRDEAGATITVDGGSFIGRGRFYEAYYPPSAVNLWPAGGVTFNDTRFEVRSGHIGQLFYQVPGKTGTQFMSVKINNVMAILFGQDIDLLSYGGRLRASIDGVHVLGGGFLNIRQHPTLGFTADGSGGDCGSVEVKNSYGVRYKKATTSSYGTYDDDFTSRVSIRNGQNYASSIYTVDAQGFIYVSDAHGTFNQLSRVVSNHVERGTLIFGRDKEVAGIGSIKGILPSGARPTKLFAYKQPLRLNEAHGWNLYLVKDVSEWVDPANFDPATDAILVATTGSTLNLSGYFEAPVQLGSNVFGSNNLAVGEGSWTEGRFYLEKTGGSNWAGWVGLEYF